jgi:hypothetical protein
MAPLFFNLVTRWRCVVSFKPLPLYPRGNSPPLLSAQEARWAPVPILDIMEKKDTSLSCARFLPTKILHGRREASTDDKNKYRLLCE